jgi:hypothetical protein
LFFFNNLFPVFDQFLFFFRCHDILLLLMVKIQVKNKEKKIPSPSSSYQIETSPACGLRLWTASEARAVFIKSKRLRPVVYGYGRRWDSKKWARFPDENLAQVCQMPSAGASHHYVPAPIPVWRWLADFRRAS